MVSVVDTVIAVPVYFVELVVGVVLLVV